MTKIRNAVKIALIFSLCCMFALSGCTVRQENSLSSETGSTVSDTPEQEDTISGQSSEPDTSEDASEPSSESSIPATNPSSVASIEQTAVSYDETMEHQILVCDIKNQSIVQMDLNRCDGDFSNLTSEDCVVWEWSANEDPNCHFVLGYGLDDAKLRYSAYWERDVIIASSSNGWAGVIDYEARTILWEAQFDNCPHSVEMLPNGDLILAGSGGDEWETKGELVYIPLSKGQMTCSDVLEVPSCHGVQWDPQREILWVLDYYGVIGVRANEDGTLSKIDGVGAEFGAMDQSGHDLSPVYGEPGKYWVTAHRKVWQFNAETSELTSVYDRSLTYSKQDVKGIAYFADGTMVSCVGGVGINLHASWSTKALYVTTFNTAGEADTAVALFDDREFYKVRTCSKDYQM